MATPIEKKIDQCIKRLFTKIEKWITDKSKDYTSNQGNILKQWINTTFTCQIGNI